MGLTVSFVYNRLKYLDREGRAAVTVRICVNRKNKYYGPGVHLLPKQWDAKNSQAKNHPEAYDINEHLSDVRKRIFGRYREGLRDGIEYSAAQLLEYIKGGKRETFNDFLRREIDRQKSHLAEATTGQHDILLGKLNRFNAEIFFQEITYQLIAKFESFLKLEDNYRGGKLSQNYIASLLSILRKYFKEAKRQGYIKDNPFDNFTIKRDATEKVWLTLKEIEKIEALDLSGRRGKVEVYRDAFVFSCYTGLRFSDIATLNQANFKESEAGFRLLKTPQKTRRKGISVDLPLYSLFAGKPEKIVHLYPAGSGVSITSLQTNISLSLQK